VGDVFDWLTLAVHDAFDTVLVSSIVYDSAGRVWKVTDPKAREARTEYDALGRTTKTIENYVDGTVRADNDRTTEYTFGLGGMTSLTAKQTGGGGEYAVGSGKSTSPHRNPAPPPPTTHRPVAPYFLLDSSETAFSRRDAGRPPLSLLIARSRPSQGGECDFRRQRSLAIRLVCRTWRSGHLK
jgi:YD repeat-containing protein